MFKTCEKIVKKWAEKLLKTCRNNLAWCEENLAQRGAQWETNSFSITKNTGFAAIFPQSQTWFFNQLITTLSTISTTSIITIINLINKRNKL
jgi:hypothetical protein